MLAAACANVGLFCKAICCSSSSVMVFCSGAGVCAWPGDVTIRKAQEKQTTSRATQRSGDTSINVTGIVRLFMFVLHARHVHLHRLFAFLFFSKVHNVIVLVWRQHAYERHHSGHEAAPAWTQVEI